MKTLPPGYRRTAGVAGMGRSGAAAARLLASRGYDVTGFDSSHEACKPGFVSRLVTGTPSPDSIRGLAMMVLSPGIPPSADVCRMCREAGVPVMAEVELAWAASRAETVAITGSNGKTTTVEWTRHVLDSVPGFKGAVAAGNVGYAFSDAVLERPDCPVFVLELSSYQLELIEDLKPHVAAFLNLTPDHLARHGTMEAYGDAKARIFMNQDRRDTSILNLDDPALERFEHTAGGTVMHFSLERRVARGAWMDSDGYLVFSNGEHDIRVIHSKDLPVPGRHNAANALAVICLCASIGVDPELIGRAITGFTGVPHRLEALGNHCGLTWINDSKSTNVDSLKVALESVSGKVLLLAGGEKKESDYSVLSQLIREKTSGMVLFGAGAADLRKQWRDTVPVIMADDLEEAVNMAVRSASPGSSILLSPGCASFDQYRNFEERGEHFRKLVGGLE